MNDGGKYGGKYGGWWVPWTMSLSPWDRAHGLGQAAGLSPWDSPGHGLGQAGPGPWDSTESRLYIRDFICHGVSEDGSKAWVEEGPVDGLYFRREARLIMNGETPEWRWRHNGRAVGKEAREAIEAQECLLIMHLSDDPEWETSKCDVEIAKQLGKMTFEDEILTNDQLEKWLGRSSNEEGDEEECDEEEGPNRGEEGG